MKRIFVVKNGNVLRVVETAPVIDEPRMPACVASLSAAVQVARERREKLGLGVRLSPEASLPQCCVAASNDGWR